MTIEEIQSAIKDSEDLRKGVVNIALGTEEGKTALTSASETYWKENIGSEVKKIHGIYDEKVKSIFGVEKDDNVKSSEFIEGYLKKLKDLEGKEPEEVKTLKAKIAELEKTGGDEKLWHDTYKKEKEQWSAKLEEYQNKVNDLIQEKTKNTIVSKLNNGLSDLQFNDTIPESVRKTFIENAKKEISKSAKIDENGNVTFYKEDGTIWKNENMSQATASEILSEKLKDIMKPKSNPGGGAPQGGEPGKIIKVGEGKESTEKLVLDKSKFTTQAEFTQVAQKALLELGIPRTDKKFRELQTEAFKEYEVDKLKMN